VPWVGWAVVQASRGARTYLTAFAPLQVCSGRIQTCAAGRHPRGLGWFSGWIAGRCGRNC